MLIERFLQKNQMKILLFSSLFILCIITLGYLINPSLFYDQWIWQYYWGPVVSDAAGYPVAYHGITAYEGYTYISEITYGIILLVCLYVIYQLLKRLKILVDWRFCLALLPYIIYGPVTRVLEDADYFSVPVVYWFISPLIYLQIAVVVIVFLLLGWFIERRFHYINIPPWIVYIFIILLVNISYITLFFTGIQYGAYVIHPLIVLLLSIISFIPQMYQWFTSRRITINTVIFSGGILVLSPTVYLICRWILGYQWSATQGVRFDVFILITGLISIIIFGVFFISKRFKDNPTIEPYGHPLNLSLFVGHLIDGITSYISIYDPLRMGLPSYIEKHPGSNFLMEVWPPLFPIVKFVLIVLIIYFFDVLYKKELLRYQRLVNLIKIGILILGFSPGLRDLLRVTMGV